VGPVKKRKGRRDDDNVCQLRGRLSLSRRCLVEQRFGMRYRKDVGFRPDYGEVTTMALRGEKLPNFLGCQCFRRDPVRMLDSQRTDVRVIECKGIELARMLQDDK